MSKRMTAWERLEARLSLYDQDDRPTLRAAVRALLYEAADAASRVPKDGVNGIPCDCDACASYSARVGAAILSVAKPRKRGGK